MNLFSSSSCRRAGAALGKAGLLVVAWVTLFQSASTGLAASGAIPVGTGVSFYATADGYPAPTFQWRKNGTAIAGATNQTFAISSATLADGAAYSVVATNASGSATSPDEVLVVETLANGSVPSITTQPIASQTAAAGSTVTISVVATGTPAPTYQWLKNGAPIGGWTAATLSMPGVTVNDNATYTVVVTNVFGSVTSSGSALTIGVPAPVNVAPAITQQPTASQTVSAGGSVSFVVVATGSPAPSYQWRKNGSNLAGATNSTLALSTLTTNDTATYTAVVSNAAGTVTSGNAVLSVTVTPPSPVNTAPSILAQPIASQTAGSGATATMAVSASGTPAPTYQWRKNSSPLSGATNSSLTISALTVNDSATYTVVVTNVAGSVTSNGSALTVTPPAPVNVAPVITSQPVSSQSALVGASVTLSVAASGTPAPSYQWLKNNVPMAGATDASLVLGGLAVSDSATYTAVATNVAGSATSNSSALSVTAPATPPPVVQPPTVSQPPISQPPISQPSTPPSSGVSSAPSITAQPRAQAIAGGTTATLSVSASGSPSPTYQWRKNGQSIAGATSSTLSLRAVTTADAATYSVIASNSLGSVLSESAAIDVNLAPVITAQPNSQAVASGSSARFSASVAAIPGATYQWRRNGTPLAGATSSVLNISSVRSTDVGDYTLVATNSLGVTSSRTVSLIVAAPPIITRQPVSRTVTTKSNVTFTVAASGTPVPTYQWKRDGVAIPGATNASLSLKSVAVSDSGQYSAEATNVAGWAVSARATLVVEYVPGRKPTDDDELPSAGVTDPNVGSPEQSVISSLVNLSVRANAGVGSGGLIVGFVVDGTASKSVLVRGVGPTLRDFGVGDALLDPKLALYSGATVTASNDDWSTNDNVALIRGTAVRVGAFNLADSAADSALMSTLASGAYTVQLSGKDATGGTALVEVYDAAAANGARLVNLSVRARIGAGAEAPNVGFVIAGTTPKRVLLRAVGPTLGAFGVTDAIADPQLELFHGDTRVSQNDNWGGGADLTATFAQVGAFGFADASSRDAVMVTTLNPGAYTVVVSGVNESSGIGLVELYELP